MREVCDFYHLKSWCWFAQVQSCKSAAIHNPTNLGFIVSPFLQSLPKKLDTRSVHVRIIAPCNRAQPRAVCRFLFGKESVACRNVAKLSNLGKFVIAVLPCRLPRLELLFLANSRNVSCCGTQCVDALFVLFPAPWPHTVVLLLWWPC